MFQNLSDRILGSINKISGKGRISEKNIKDTVREVEKSLLEADVALPVVKKFIMNVRQKAIGQNVMKSLTPGQELIRIVQKQLVTVMGNENVELNLRAQPPVVILMAGLQGSGKTTTTGKLARLLKNKHKKKVMVVSTDIYRPAAIEQLQTLSREIDVEFFPSTPDQKPVDIVKNAKNAAKTQVCDVLIVDTAGRLHVDDDMMTEIKELHKISEPTETLFVVDSMTGQDAAITAKEFHDAVPLTGVILTKLDGDSRGGAALSITQITEVPIKFIGLGEKSDALQAFHPDRIASRILGMGDVLSLIEQVEENVDREKAEKMAKKLKKGNFDFNDFRDQLAQMKNMGGIGAIIDKLPGMSAVSEQVKAAADEDMFKGVEAIINSMTISERRDPELMSPSRKKRISMGAGRDIQEVNKFLKQFKMMQKMVKKMSKKGGMRKMMSMMKGMQGGAGGMPPGISH